MDKTMHVDLDEKQLDDLSIGDVVEVVTKGEIKELDAGQPPDDDWDGMPPSMRIEVAETNVKVAENAISKIADDDEQ